MKVFNLINRLLLQEYDSARDALYIRRYLKHTYDKNVSKRPAIFDNIHILCIES